MGSEQARDRDLRREADRTRWLLEEEARVARLLVAGLQTELEQSYGRLDDVLDEVVRSRTSARERACAPLPPEQTASSRPSATARLRALARRLRRQPQPPPEPPPAFGPEPEPPPSFAEIRRQVAERFLEGEGIEIGALNEPLQVPATVRVTYVDRLPLEGLRKHYPEFDGTPLVAPDVVTNGETLSEFGDASVDFVVANHFIEHCQDPLGTLEQHLRVVRNGGIVYLAVPDKRRTFDSGRTLTTLEHLLADHRDGPEASRWDHFVEWAIVKERAGAACAVELAESNYSIHFHVWTPDTFLAFLYHCRTELGLPFELVAYEPNDFEFIVVLRRSAREAPVDALVGLQEEAAASGA